MPDTPLADATTEPATGAPEAPEATEPTTDTPAPDYEAEAAKWKALSRKHEDQAKANADAARRLAEIEEANKTEDEKRAEREKALITEKAQLESELARTRAAVKFGLNDDDLAALDGIPADKVETVAARIAAGRAPSKPAPTVDGQGRVGSPIEGEKQLTQADLAGMSPEQINAARRAGLLKTILHN